MWHKFVIIGYGNAVLVSLGEGYREGVFGYDLVEFGLQVVENLLKIC